MAERSAEERRRRAEANRRWLENMSPEQRAAHVKRIRERRVEWEARQDPEQLEIMRQKWRQTFYEYRRRRSRNLRRARERVAQWARENPERVEEHRRRYVLKHPERVRESKRAYYHRHSEAIRERRLARENPEKITADQRRWRAAYVRKESTWTPSEEQRAAYRKASADARRLARRLAAAGLPPRRLQRVTAAQRRLNAREADAFFGRRHSWLAVRREGERTPSVLYWRFINELRIDRQRREVAAVAREQLRRHGARLQAEVALDARARAVRGAPPQDPEIELYRKLTDLVDRGAPKLTGSIPPFALVPARGWSPGERLSRGGEALTR